MATVLEQSSIDEKARELCELIVDQPAFIQAREHIETFLDDPRAQSVYRLWQEKAQELHRMSHEGLQPNDQDIQKMESLRQAVITDGVASKFIEGEEKLNEIFASVTKLLQETLKLGRVPSEAEMAADSGCCGSHGGGGCGCH